MVMISGINGTQKDFLTAAEAAGAKVLNRRRCVVRPDGIYELPSFKRFEGIKKSLFFTKIKEFFTGLPEKFTKVKEFFTNLPEKLPRIKQFVSDKFTALKGKFTVENLKATKEKVITAFKSIPAKLNELKGKISNNIFNDAMKHKFANINWKSAGIKGAIIGGALLALYAGVKVIKSIFGKNNA